MVQPRGPALIGCGHRSWDLGRGSGWIFPVDLISHGFPPAGADRVESVIVHG